MEIQPIQNVESNEAVKKPAIVFARNNITALGMPTKRSNQFFENGILGEIRKSMQLLAEACIGQEKLEYLALFDPLASDFAMSNQNFFDEVLENELTKVGINVKVFGMMGGSSEAIIKVIKEKYPDWEGSKLPKYWDDRSYLLYKVENSSGK